MQDINKLFNIDPLRKKIITYTNKDKKNGILKKIKISINNKINYIRDIINTITLKLIICIFRIH